MRRWTHPALLTLGLLLPAAVAAPSPDAKPDPAANAALKYWQAFAQVPALDKDQEKLLEEWDKAPLDAAALKLLGSSKNALLYLHRGARLSRCDWALDYEDGPGLLLPHLAKARNLARLAGLHARHQFEQGRFKEGTEDVTAILTLARHVRADPILISILVGYAIETIAIDAIAPSLPKLDAASLKLLSNRLESLPAGATPSQAILVEKMHMGGWLLRKLREAEKAKTGGWRDVVNAVFDSPEDYLKSVDTFDKAVGQAEELLPVYDRLAKVIALPPAEFDAQYPDFFKKAKAENPLAGLLFPKSEKVVAAQRRNQAQVALLKAAIAVVRDGPEKLKGIKDPFGDGPFEYRAVGKGFELKSKLLFRGKPVTLMVGQAKAE